MQITIALALLAGLVQLWQSSLLQGQLLLKSQTEKMARLLVQQTAYGAAPALLLQNDEQLQWLATALVEDPKVMSAAIYGEQGTRLSFAQSLTSEWIEPDSEEMKTLLAPYPPYVESVIQDEKNLGYVEVRLDPKLFLAEIEEVHKLNMEQQQIMLLVAGLIGMLLSRAMSFKRAHFDRRKFRAKRYLATMTGEMPKNSDTQLAASAEDTNHATANSGNTPETPISDEATKIPANTDKP
ncbi:AhpA/YtjB family protein [Shewanella sp.]|uniref:AhpA/YtjB family protein n=1 Tax=Shewanella sp. TaxID=50422 RepID=UPI003569485F